jgi:hypothetical protein
VPDSVDHHGHQQSGPAPACGRLAFRPAARSAGVREVAIAASVKKREIDTPCEVVALPRPPLSVGGMRTVLVIVDASPSLIHAGYVDRDGNSVIPPCPAFPCRNKPSHAFGTYLPGDSFGKSEVSRLHP